MSAAATETNAETRRARSAVLASGLGNALEWYDIVLFGFMSSSITAAFYPNGDFTAQLMTWATFAITFVVRPLGAVIIGRFADRRGRRSALTLTIAMMTLGIFIIVVTPGYATIGIWAAIILVIARVLQGLSAGGEFGSATAFLTENARRHKAYYASFQTASQGIAVGLAASVAWLVTSTLSTEALHSWGWRVAFAVGLLIGPVGWYIRMRLEDTQEFQAVEAERSPLRTLLGHYSGRLLAAFLIVAVATFAIYLLTYLPQFAITNLGLPAWSSFPGALTAGAVTLIGSPFVGRLADRIGPSTIMIPASVVAVVLAWPMFLLLTHAPSVALMTLCEAGIGVFLAFYFGPLPALLSEFFPIQVRSSGMTIAYSFGVAIFGGFAPLILTALVKATGIITVPGWYFAACALLSLGGVLAARFIYRQR